MHNTDSHPSNISQLWESQRERSCPHGPPVPEGTSAIKLVPGRLIHITEVRRGQLLQYMDDPRTIPPVGGFAVLLGKPSGAKQTGFTTHWHILPTSDYTHNSALVLPTTVIRPCTCEPCPARRNQHGPIWSGPRSAPSPCHRCSQGFLIKTGEEHALRNLPWLPCYCCMMLKEVQQMSCTLVNFWRKHQAYYCYYCCYYCSAWTYVVAIRSKGSVRWPRREREHL